MQGRSRIGWWLMTVGATESRVWKQQMRLMGTKLPTRSAVHGIRLPVSETLDEEEVEPEIKKGKEEKQKKRKEVEEKVDSQLNRLEESVGVPIIKEQ